MSRPGGKGMPRPKKAAAPAGKKEVVISRKQRGGRKYVTTVTGLKAFGAYHVELMDTYLQRLKRCRVQSIGAWGRDAVDPWRGPVCCHRY
jgi:hypothetical protein